MSKRRRSNMLNNGKITGKYMKLEIKELYASAGGKEILSGVSLSVSTGEFHVIMGPNGSGKTTLAKAIMGSPGIEITKGEILVDGNQINDLSPDKRALLGLFLQFQNPVEIGGVGYVSFLRSVLEKKTDSTVSTKELMERIKEYTSKLQIDHGIIGRSLNEGFSGGEKKKSEVLQMAVIKPKIAILDEPDSGLDVDAVRIVANNINEISERLGMGLLVITHYNRILSYMKPQFAHILYKGKIVYSGAADAVDEIERNGYEKFTR